MTERIQPETQTHLDPEHDSGELANVGGEKKVPVPDFSRDPAVVPDLAEIDVPDGLRGEIEELMSRYPDRHSAALPALAAAQKLHGWCSPEAIEQVAAVMQVTPAYLSSVATFYDMLNTEPVGRHYVWVCTSVACMPRNAKAVFEAIKEAGGDLEDVHIREFECLGACDMAPMASVDGRYIGPLQPGDAEQIVEALRRGETPLPGRGLGDEGRG
jgi:NADH-quinone oxidoreductase subunit E